MIAAAPSGFPDPTSRSQTPPAMRALRRDYAVIPTVTLFVVRIDRIMCHKGFIKDVLSFERSLARRMDVLRGCPNQKGRRRKSKARGVVIGKP